MRGVITLAAALLLLGGIPTLASGQAAPADEPVTIVEDPEGDAYEKNGWWAHRQHRKACLAARPVTLAACNAAYEAGVTETRDDLGTPGLEPAAPSLDILAVRMEETPTHLTVHVDMAELDADLSQWHREQPSGQLDVAELSVLWAVDPEPGCSQRVYLWSNPNGLIEARYESAGNWCLPEDDSSNPPFSGECETFAFCNYEVPYTITPGAPATITWEVPREWMLDARSGTVLQDVSAQTMRYEDWLQTGTFRLAANLYGQRVFEADIAPTETTYPVDVTEAGAFEFVEGLEPLPPAPTPSPWKRLPEGDVEDPRADMLSFDIIETEESLQMTATYADVRLDGDGAMYYWYLIDLPEGTLFLPGVWVEDGEVWSWGNTARGYLGAWHNTPRRAVPIEVDIVEGSPGTVSITASRGDLPPIEAGSLTASTWPIVFHFPSALGETYGEEGPLSYSLNIPDWGDEERLMEYDGVLGGPPYRFQDATPESMYEGLVQLADDPGDATLPATVMDERAADQLDILYAEARPLDEDRFKLTIGISDLSTVQVPDLYDALYYGIGLESDYGTHMVGYHRSARESAGQFLCAQDTTVLAEAQRDPTQAVWTIIDGLVTAPPSGGGGGGGPGSLTFYVPYECLGAPAGEVLTFERFQVGTFLVQNPQARAGEGSVHEADALTHGAPVVISEPPVDEQLQASAWYAAPMGVENFWDMAGIGFAALAAVVAGGVKLRHRRRDKRVVAEAKLAEDREVYKAALAKAVARGTSDPDDDEVLQALRRRLGIGEREHALLLLEARTAAGLADGLEPGERFLGKYVIERRLGEGGFARTFLARDEKLDRKVVLKIARWDDEKEAARALREGRILARLSHPNIVAIHDIEEVAGQLALVLEHMPRGSLADIIEQGPVTTAEALSIAEDVLEGLAAAHRAGVVHQDVKPSNILLTAEGRAKLADFGIARRGANAGTASGLSLGGNGAGTLGYMAPEQARGAPADERTDLYALGVVLYEALTGRPYLHLDGLSEYDVRTAIIEDEALLPIEGVPEALNEVLARVLAKDPGERPGSAEAVLEALAKAAVAP